MSEVEIKAYDKNGNEIDYAIYDTDYTRTFIEKIKEEV